MNRADKIKDIKKYIRWQEMLFDRTQELLQKQSKKIGHLKLELEKSKQEQLLMMESKDDYVRNIIRYKDALKLLEE